MNEKMIQALEAGLYRVLDTALSKVDAMYPLRGHMTIEYLAHRDCVAVILSWFEQQVAGIRRLRFSLAPIGGRFMRPYEEEESFDDWDILLDFFGSPDTAWMMRISLSALPKDIRQLLSKITQIINVAFDGGIQQCLHDLKVLAHSLAKNTEDVKMLNRLITSSQLHSNESKIRKIF